MADALLVVNAAANAAADPSEVDLSKVDLSKARASTAPVAVSMRLPDIHCAGCCFRIEARLAKLPYVQDASVHLAEKRLTATLDSEADQATLEAELKAMGYPGVLDADAESQAADPAQRHQLARIGVAGIGMMQVMMFALATYLAGDGMSQAYEQLMRWASFVIAVPVMFYSALPFHRAAWHDLKSGMPGMDVPVSIAISTAFFLSAWHTLVTGGEVYFDSVCMFTFLLLLGRYLESFVRQHYRIDQSIGERLLPRLARRASGEEVRLLDLQPGDLLKVLPGETMPADGLVEAGSSSAIEAAFTGEPMPMTKLKGTEVLAGSQNVDGELLIRVTSRSDAFMISRLSDMQRNAANYKPPFAKLADRIARWFVVLVLMLASLTGALLLWTGAENWLVVMLSVLVVSCPCALSLATPVAWSIAGGTLGRRGLMIRDGAFLEKLARVTTVIFDRTGTLTQGKPTLVGVDLVADLPELSDEQFDERSDERSDKRFDKQWILNVAASLEASSRHPLAEAIRHEASSLYPVSQQETLAGQGVSGVIDGAEYQLGKAAWLGVQPPAVHEGVGEGVEEGADEGASKGVDEHEGTVAVGLARNGELLGWLHFRDQLAAGLPEMLKDLRRLGLRLGIYTGAQLDPSVDVGTDVGVGDSSADGEHQPGKGGILASDILASHIFASHIFAKELVVQGMSPADKLAGVMGLQQQGQRVLMVGDGINDTSAMSGAWASLAVNPVDRIVQSATDAVVTGSLARLPEYIRYASRVRSVVTQNLLWAFAYNMTLIPLAVMGLVPPWLAALGMSLSSLLVLLNACRLVRD